MKILQIKGKNLASLQDEFCIDFTSEPLQSAGIFAITGPTGSGKSTLLDALCLALYNRTPRTSLKADQIQIMDTASNTISQTSPGSILRRGCVEGYAEVLFVGIDGKEYRAHWEIARAYKKATGKLGQEQIRLYNLTDDKEEQGTKTTLLKRLETCIGLTYDQFTRTVLLAQGEFATFLRAKGSEKAELLEKLTGTEIYARISSTIYELNNQAKIDLQAISTKIEGIEVLNDDEREDFRKQLSALKDTFEKQKVEGNQLHQQVEWFVERDKINGSVEESKKGLAEKEIAWEENAERYRKLEDVVLVQDVKTPWNEVNRLNNALQKQQALKDEKAKEEKDWKEKLKDSQEKLAKAEADLKRINERYSALQPEIEAARKKDNALENSAKTITDKNSEVKNLSSKASGTQNKINSLSATIEATDKRIKAYDTWYKEHEVYKSVLLEWTYVRDLYERWNGEEAQAHKFNKALEAVEKELNDKNEQIKKIKEGLDELRGMVSLEVIKLREELEPDKPCPVCGSLHHPIRSLALDEKEALRGEEIAQSIGKAEKELETTTTLYNQAVLRQARLQTQIESNSTNAIKDKEALLSIAATIPEYEKLISEKQFLNHLEPIKKEWDKQHEENEKDVNTLREQRPQLENEQRTYKEQNQELNTKKEELKQLETEHATLVEERKKLLKGESISDIEQKFSNFVNERNEVLNVCRDTNHQAQTRIEVITNELKLNKETETQIEEDLKEQKKLLDKSIADLNKPELQEHLSELLLFTNQWIRGEQAFFQKLKDDKLALATQLKERNHQYELHEQQKPSPLSETLEIARQSENAVKQLLETTSNQVTTLQVKLKSDEENAKRRKSYEKAYNEAREKSENWNKLCSVLGQKDGGKFKAFAQQYTLDTLLVYTNQQLNALSNRYILERIPGELSLQVVDREMMNEVRSVLSLSGGESFLLSLGLALGLSSLSSNRMRVESLFIDEGFGSLDPETLNIALEALESLQMQGRKIGVISHVAEMNERISTRIELEKTTGGQSKIAIH